MFSKLDHDRQTITAFSRYLHTYTPQIIYPFLNSFEIIAYSRRKCIHPPFLCQIILMGEIGKVKIKNEM
jgi:hypothetical protein